MVDFHAGGHVTNVRNVVGFHNAWKAAVAATENCVPIDWMTPVRKSSPSALQFGVSRGRREVLLSGYGRVYLSEIVSEFGPKTWPRCRDSETQIILRIT